MQSVCLHVLSTSVGAGTSACPLVTLIMWKYNFVDHIAQVYLVENNRDSILAHGGAAKGRVCPSTHSSVGVITEMIHMWRPSTGAPRK